MRLIVTSRLFNWNFHFSIIKTLIVKTRLFVISRFHCIGDKVRNKIIKFSANCKTFFHSLMMTTRVFETWFRLRFRALIKFCNLKPQSYNTFSSLSPLNSTLRITLYFTLHYICLPAGPAPPQVRRLKIFRAVQIFVIRQRFVSAKVWECEQSIYFITMIK